MPTVVWSEMIAHKSHIKSGTLSQLWFENFPHSLLVRLTVLAWSCPGCVPLWKSCPKITIQWKDNSARAHIIHTKTCLWMHSILHYYLKRRSASCTSSILAGNPPLLLPREDPPRFRKHYLQRNNSAIQRPFPLPICGQLSPRRNCGERDESTMADNHHQTRKRRFLQVFLHPGSNHIM